MNIIKSVSIKEVARIRDKLVKTLESAEKKGLTEKEIEEINIAEMYDNTLEWVIEEIQEAFDFDGEEE